MAALPEGLTEAQFVACTLCRVSMTGAEVLEHDANPEHQRRAKEFILDRAVQKVSGWKCPGPVFRASERSRTAHL